VVVPPKIVVVASICGGFGTTVTVTVACADPKGPMAVSVYVSVVVGLTTTLPHAGTITVPASAPRPEMETVVALVAHHVS
jgi:hypothetical protein